MKSSHHLVNVTKFDVFMFVGFGVCLNGDFVQIPRLLLQESGMQNTLNGSYGFGQTRNIHISYNIVSC